MNNNEIDENLTSKMKLIYYCVDKNKIIPKDPIFRLPFNIEDIRSILELDNTKIIKYLFFNRESIDKELFELEKEEEIQIKYDMVKKGLHNLFYLDLILNYNSEIMNYKFDKKFIKEIYKRSIKENKNKFEQIILSKITNDLINYYKLTEYYDESKEKEELNEFQKNISEKIENNITIFKALKLDFTIEDIFTKKIDILYKEIIQSLIKLKFNDNTIDIFNQLDLENIILSESITDELWEILISTDFVNYFNLDDLKDVTNLFNSQKIHFFYIIFKYIFKRNVYSFKTELFDLRKKIFTILFIDENKKYIFESKNKIPFLAEYNKLNYYLKDQFFFFLRSLLILNYSKYYKRILKEIQENDPYILLNNSYFKYTINKKKENESPFDNFELIHFKEKNYQDIPKELRDNLPEIITFMNDFKEKIEKKCNNNYKLIITLKLNIVGELNDLVDKPYNINCIYELEKLGFDSDDENKVKRYKDENILVNGLSEGFEFLIEEINDEYYNKINNNN